MKKAICLLAMIAMFLSMAVYAVEKPQTVASEKLEAVGQAIQDYQKDEVWPGGNEYSGCYMWTSREDFLSRGGANIFVQRAKSNPVFLSGAKELAKLTKSQRFGYYNRWLEPVYPTWAMLGQICSKGTTDAGWMTQREIANALVNLIKDMYLHPEKYKQ